MPGTYSDNEVGDAGVAAKAQRRFEAGELVKIDKVNAKRQRVDLLLTLAVPLRTSRIDGPFELFDERECQVQLIVPLAREDVKMGNDTKIAAQLEESITVYPSLEDARESDAWNEREMQPLPADYEQTLQKYTAWKAEQTNAAVSEALHRAIDDAADVADDLSDDADYTRRVWRRRRGDDLVQHHRLFVSSQRLPVVSRHQPAKGQTETLARRLAGRAGTDLQRPPRRATPGVPRPGASSTMIVAGIQFDIAWEEPTENFGRVAPLIQQAVQNGARLIALPEMFATGFSMRSEAMAADASTITDLSRGDGLRLRSVGGGRLRRTR